jgi:YesN/AraC family two-component response regulator
MNNLQGLRILIVDDERFMRSTIKAALRVVGCLDIAEAADGETALRLVGEYKGIAGYLVKPISPKQLEDRLRAIFRHRQPD